MDAFIRGRADDGLIEVIEGFRDFLILVIREGLIGHIEQDVVFFFDVLSQKLHITAAVQEEIFFIVPCSRFPQVGDPAIYVAQPYGGMDPAQMEGFLTYYYEYHFLYITGIDHVESKSIQGAARIQSIDALGNLPVMKDGQRDTQLRNSGTPNSGILQH